MAPAWSVSSNVAVRDPVPPELSFAAATDGGRLVNGEVVWNLGTVQPKERRAVRVTMRAERIATVVNQAVATAEGGIQVEAKAGLEILGIPAFKLEVVDLDDPVEVGKKLTYRIEVTNTGSLPGNQVEVRAVGPQARATTA